MQNRSQFKEGLNTYNNIDFFINRKRIRNLIIKINSKNEIVVSLPVHVKDDFIKKFLEVNLNKFRQLQEKNYQNVSINIQSNWFYLFGEKKYFENDKENKKIIIDNKKISYANKTINEAIDSYRKKHLKVYLLVRQLQFQKIMKIDDHVIRIRNKVTAWATNHIIQKVIYYSTNLSSFSKDVIDYVIVHELAHNKFPNHSKEFWNLVSTYEPGYKTKRTKLKKSIYF